VVFPLVLEGSGRCLARSCQCSLWNIFCGQHGHHHRRSLATIVANSSPKGPNQLTNP
jgi:hypothetical protein